MPIPADFHADEFAYVRPPSTPCRRLTLELHAASAASEKLAGRLQEIIAQRLQTSREPVRELERVVAELRDMGHPLEVDEDDRDWTIYADRPHRNLAIWVHWGDAGHTRVAQTEVLWQRM